MSAETPIERTQIGVLVGGLIPNLWDALRRFPLAAVFPVLFSAYYLFAGDTLFGLPRPLTDNLGWELAAGFLWTLCVAIWAEAADKSWWDRLLANLCGLAAIMLLLSGSGVLHTSPVLLLLTIALALSLSSHHGLDERNAAFLAFNQRLWLGAAAAIIAGLLCVMVLLGGAGAVEYLFDLRMPHWLFAGVWIAVMGLLAPLCWLTLVPSVRSKTGHGAGSEDVVAGAMVLLVRYVFVPLLLLFALVLYRYALKIVQDGDMPNGRLGPVILVFLFSGTATYVMCHRARLDGGVLVRFFWRYWFAISLVPIAMLALATYARIDAYGLTEQRYLLALVVVWSLFLACAILLLKARDLRLIPAALAALLIVGSFGPVGARGLSLRSQHKIVAGLLRDNGLLAAGKVMVKRDDQFRFRHGDDVRIRSIIEFFSDRGELRQFASWFAGTPGNPFAAVSRDRASSAAAVASALGVLKSPIGQGESRTVIFYAHNPTVASTLGAGYLAGPLNLSLAPNSSREVRKIAVGTGRDLAVTLEEQALLVVDRRGRTALFDLVAVARKVPWFERHKAVAPALTEPLSISSAGGTLRARLLLTSLQGQRATSGGYAFNQLSGWLLLPAGGSGGASGAASGVSSSVRQPASR